ncbi:hypothetical protein [Mesorhizobium sp. M1378]|uniref:hypothetical protein n=1 Tax=unclassified Mesorhizobium TaxID=325217 RepID=UPI003336F018
MNHAYWRVAGFLKPNHFADKLHGAPYEIVGTTIAGAGRSTRSRSSRISRLTRRSAI